MLLLWQMENFYIPSHNTIISNMHVTSGASERRLANTIEIYDTFRLSLTLRACVSHCHTPVNSIYNPAVSAWAVDCDVCKCTKIFNTRNINACEESNFLNSWNLIRENKTGYIRLWFYMFIEWHHTILTLHFGPCDVDIALFIVILCCNNSAKCTHCVYTFRYACDQCTKRLYNAG